MIFFRKANEPHLREANGICQYWHVEFYDDETPGGLTSPVGVAYVCELVGKQAAQLNFIFVADQWRGNGYGKQLVEAIKARWPNLTWTGGMDERGEGLLRSCGLVFDE